MHFSQYDARIMVTLNTSRLLVNLKGSPVSPLFLPFSSELARLLSAPLLFVELRRLLDNIFFERENVKSYNLLN